MMLASNMRLLCCKHPKISINLFLQELYKTPRILIDILEAKHKKTNTKPIEKAAAYALIQIKNKLENQ